MSARSEQSSSPRRALWLIAALGALARMVACFFDSPLHPDEYFQYLEPAWWHLTGSGQETWEWMDGVRSWVLPFYNGSWMAALFALGVPPGRPIVMVLKLHWALINTALVWVAYRGSASVARRLLGDELQRTWRGLRGDQAAGLVGALAVAAFPLMVVYAGHTLSELPSMLCLIAGLVLTLELQESRAPGREALWRAASIGALLSLGACLRIANAPLVLLSPAWLLATRRFREFGCLVAAALAPALVFALVDLLTWGTLAGSFIGYVKFNLIEGKAADFGTEPPIFYVAQIWRRMPWTLPLVVVPALAGLRTTWPLVVSAALSLAYLSTQAHKEERFIVLVWPLLLMAASAVTLAWLWTLREGAKGRRAALALTAFGCAFVGLNVDAGLHAGGRTWPEQGRLEAQAWIGQQNDVTGLLVDWPIDSAGGLWFGNIAPQMQYKRELLNNPLISHVLVTVGSKRFKEALDAGFERAYRRSKFQVLSRPKLPPRDPGDAF